MKKEDFKKLYRATSKIIHPSSCYVRFGELKQKAAT